MYIVEWIALILQIKSSCKKLHSYKDKYLPTNHTEFNRSDLGNLENEKQFSRDTYPAGPI